MVRSMNGSFRLLHVAGISVYLNWTWFVLGILWIQGRLGSYSSIVWSVAEFVTLFGIVLLHEFGHALACRQVGGVANTIMLWPLGGIAYASPPPRPGATLWTVAAGPLVNVVLVPVTAVLWWVVNQAGWDQTAPNLHHYLMAVFITNAILLTLNLLPIYPLDGGQILQSVLWFIMGRARSLMTVSVIGLVLGIALTIVALRMEMYWIALLAGYLTLRAWAGFQQSRLLIEMLHAPRYEDLVCPSCGAAPLVGDFWVCDHCQTAFDIFEHAAVCPGCGSRFRETACPACQRRHPVTAWTPAQPVGQRQSL